MSKTLSVFDNGRGDRDALLRRLVELTCIGRRLQPLGPDAQGTCSYASFRDRPLLEGSEADAMVTHPDRNHPRHRIVQLRRPGPPRAHWRDECGPTMDGDPQAAGEAVVTVADAIDGAPTGQAISAPIESSRTVFDTIIGR